MTVSGVTHLDQTKLTMKNISAVLDELKSSIKNIQASTFYINTTDEGIAADNKITSVLARYMHRALESNPSPVLFVLLPTLPKGCLVEIGVITFMDSIKKVLKNDVKHNSKNFYHQSNAVSELSDGCVSYHIHSSIVPEIMCLSTVAIGLLKVSMCFFVFFVTRVCRNRFYSVIAIL